MQQCLLAPECANRRGLSTVKGRQTEQWESLSWRHAEIDGRAIFGNTTTTSRECGSGNSTQKCPALHLRHRVSLPLALVVPTILLFEKRMRQPQPRRNTELAIYSVAGISSIEPAVTAKQTIAIRNV